MMKNEQGDCRPDSLLEWSLDATKSLDSDSPPRSPTKNIFAVRKNENENEIESHTTNSTIAYSPQQRFVEGANHFKATTVTSASSGISPNELSLLNQKPKSQPEVITHSIPSGGKVPRPHELLRRNNRTSSCDARMMLPNQSQVRPQSHHRVYSHHSASSILSDYGAVAPPQVPVSLHVFPPHSVASPPQDLEQFPTKENSHNRNRDSTTSHSNPDGDVWQQKRIQSGYRSYSNDGLIYHRQSSEFQRKIIRDSNSSSPYEYDRSSLNTDTRSQCSTPITRPNKNNYMHSKSSQDPGDDGELRGLLSQQQRQFYPHDDDVKRNSEDSKGGEFVCLDIN